MPDHDTAPSWRFGHMTLTQFALDLFSVETDKGKARTFRGLRARLVRALLDACIEKGRECARLRGECDDLAAARSRAMRERDEAVERERRLILMRDRYANAVEVALLDVDDVVAQRIRRALRGVT